MKTVAIICEYNPFHTGHEYQIECIRKEFGEDTRIVAIMSGSLTQRAELAVTDKFERAKWAVLAGADIVLELPLPFSMASAEYFAMGGVGIADALGAVDILSFGSESGDIARLTKIAENLDSDLFKAELLKILSEDKTVGHAKASELAYLSLYGESDIEALRMPNNILAIEYLRALSRLNSRIVPHTVRRLGAGYSENTLAEGIYPSAMAIRSSLTRGKTEALSYLPSKIRDEAYKAVSEGSMPSDIERLSNTVLTFFLLNNSERCEEIYGASDGLYHRLAAKSREATSIASFIALSETKKYTRARIRRAILASILGVTSSDVMETPGYTQLLALGKNGQRLLKQIKDASHLSILTRPSDTEGLSPVARRQRELSDKADALLALSLPSPRPIASGMRKTPYVEK